jgi:hypothetical protein
MAERGQTDQRGASGTGENEVSILAESWLENYLA